MKVDFIVESLLEGMRKDGRSIIECCLDWGMTDEEYNDMKEDSPELQRAHTVGEMHCAAWWNLCARGLAAKGNASILGMGMKNIAKVGWQDKPTIEEKEYEPVRAITIEILPPRADDV